MQALGLASHPKPLTPTLAEQFVRDHLARDPDASVNECWEAALSAGWSGRAQIRQAYQRVRNETHQPPKPGPKGPRR